MARQTKFDLLCEWLKEILTTDAHYGRCGPDCPCREILEKINKKEK